MASKQETFEQLIELRLHTVKFAFELTCCLLTTIEILQGLRYLSTRPSDSAGTVCLWVLCHGSLMYDLPL